jgi:ADP-heptose:LPS heptosyltransferase
MKNRPAAGTITVAGVKYDCRHFRGHIPCAPNKLRGKICDSCDEYEAVTKNILIIKLGAIGDVIRTTPLVWAFRKKYPGCRITWVTITPDVLPPDLVDDARRPDAMGLFPVRREQYDIAINLDKDREACMLLAEVSAPEKFGFTWKDGHIWPATPAAGDKLLTGLFDSLSRENTLNYLEEIFGICGMKFAGEEYMIRRDPAAEERWKKRAASHGGGRTIVGLNTGCGKRWTTRLWPEEYWISLIERLKGAGYVPLLMGGPDEDKLNSSYAAKTSAWYPGHFSLPEFISLSASADVVVTQVSMMMHIAIALRKPLVLMNNIFNPREFELYGRGVIVEPDSGCDCYYGSKCSRERRCMLDLGVDRVFDEIRSLAPPAAVNNPVNPG